MGTGGLITISEYTFKAMGYEGLGQAMGAAGTVYGAVDKYMSLNNEVLRSFAGDSAPPSHQYIQDALGYREGLSAHLRLLAKNGYKLGGCVECEQLTQSDYTDCKSLKRKMKQRSTKDQADLDKLDIAIEDIQKIYDSAEEKRQNAHDAEIRLKQLLNTGIPEMASQSVNVWKASEGAGQIVGAMSELKRDAKAAIIRLKSDRDALANEIEGKKTNLAHQCTQS